MPDRPSPEWGHAALVALVAGLVYATGLVTDVHWGDSAQFARNAAVLEFSTHARAYPLLRTVSWLLGEVCGSPACGANLASLVTSALAVGGLHLAARAFGANRAGALAAAATLALAHTYWSYAVVAEVYGLHALFLAALLACTPGAAAGGARSAFVLGLVLGLSLLHHRMMAFTAPVVLAWVAWTMPRERRIASLRRFAAGAALGALPFVGIAAFDLPRTLASGGTAAGWIKDTLAGGDQHLGFLAAGDAKTVPSTIAYLAKWIAFNLPGPALVLAAWGLVAGSPAAPRARWMLAALVAANLVFPFRYNWPGDQYAFLTPLYPVLGLLTGLGVTAASRRLGARAAWAGAVACVAAPLVLSACLGLTSLGPRLLPGLRPEAARDFFLVRPGRSAPAGAWCRANLDRVGPDVLLAAYWGDGEVYRYLQDVEGRRRDVHVTILLRRALPAAGTRSLWISVLPIWADPAAQAAFAGPTLVDLGGGLYRVP